MKNINWIPKFIKQIIKNKPRDLVEAEYWNGLWNLVINQGDNNAEGIEKLLAALKDTSFVYAVKDNSSVFEPDSDGVVDLGKVLKGGIEGDAPSRRLVLHGYSNDNEIPVLDSDEKIRISQLPKASSTTAGILSPEDYKVLNDIPNTLLKYVSTDKLSTEISNALQDAKESGMFDGAIGPQGPQGPQGPAGSDATVTAGSIKSALGYDPAKQSDVDNLYENKTDRGHMHFVSSIDTSDMLLTEFGDVTLDNLEMLLFSLDNVLTNKANKSTVPTKVSQLSNDSDYATKGELSVLSEEIEELKESGTGGGTSNLETEVVDVPLYIEWDGTNYSSLEEVANWYYKVSDIVPTQEQVIKGGWYTYVGNTGESHGWYVSTTDDYISLGSVAGPRIYKEGNSVGASPGIYFYFSSPTYRTTSLELTGYKVSEVVKLNEKHLPEVDVVSRQYGGFSGSTYNVPNIKVDSTGRVIEASESVITEASTKNTGLMPYGMYTYVSQGNHVTSKKNLFAVNSEWSCSIGSFKSLTMSLSEASGSVNRYIPVIHAVYAYLYTDTSKTTKRLVPAPYKVELSSASVCSVKVSCPEEYREFNLVNGDTTGASSYIEAIVVYEAIYTASSGH